MASTISGIWPSIKGLRFVLTLSDITARLAQFSAGEAYPSSGCQQLVPGFLRAFHFCSASAGDWIAPRSFAMSISLQLATIPEFALIPLAKEARLRHGL